ncbi:YidB family protein [bacterium]|nr:YidB family protein [bacterium]
MGIIEQAQEQILNIIGKANPQAVEMIKNLFQQFGGVDGIIKKFQDSGYKEMVQSWISKGANTPISAEQINQIFGNEKVKNIAQKIGVNPDLVAQQLAQYLPIVIDKLTPDGQPPTASNILSHAVNVAKGLFGKK